MNSFVNIRSIDLNCDMGEGMDNDAFIMPFISSANIACGFHAGDEEIMRKTAMLALQNHVSIGAHPSFADKENFGRTEMAREITEVYALVAQQVCGMKKICDELGTSLHHVKPHGALYNMAAKDPALANAIARAVFDINSNLIVYGLSGSFLIDEANKIGLKTASEVFADRTYRDDGSLTPRSQPNALIEDENMSIRQVLQMIIEKTVKSLSGKIIPIVADTVCIHGDGKHALVFVKKIFQTLKEKNIAVKTI